MANALFCSLIYYSKYFVITVKHKFEIDIQYVKYIYPFTDLLQYICPCCLHIYLLYRRQFMVQEPDLQH